MGPYALKDLWLTVKTRRRFGGALTGEDPGASFEGPSIVEGDARSLQDIFSDLLHLLAKAFLIDEERLLFFH